MSKYNDTVLTTAGLDLVTRAGEGQTSFKITKAEATADDLSATDLSTLTAIPHVVQTGSIVGSDAATTGVMGIKVQFTNTHLSKSYSANAVGVYATETGGKEVLYAVTTAESGHAQYMPDFSGGVKLDFGIVINVVIGKASQVTVQFDTDGLATIGFVQDAVAGLKNVAKTDESNTFTKVQTFKGGAIDQNGLPYINAQQVPKYDLTPYALNSDVLAKLQLKADASDMTAKLALKADLADMTAKLAAKVTDNKNGTIMVNGNTVTPLNAGLNVITSATDANNLITTGIWSSNGVGFTNVPAGFEMWSTIFSLDNAGSNSTQIIFNTNTGGLATRGHNSSNKWTAWLTLVSTVDLTNAINALRTELNNNINTAKQAAINQIQPMITAEFTKRNAPSAWWNGTAAQYAAVNPKVASVEYNVYE